MNQIHKYNNLNRLQMAGKVMIFALTGLIWMACAKQGFPEGGPKDVTPPKVLQMTPANGQRNFQGDEFAISFDEYVVLKDAENNILVSPPMKPKPEYKLNGKKLHVLLRDTLQQNVTYVFQFKGAIVDFNEGNPLSSLVYAFSTGSVIDSMTICGSVRDAYSHKPREKRVSVLAYAAESSDSVVSTGKPMYITQCDAAGHFAFDYIRPGRYRIVALEDADHNMQYNGDEAIAFADSLVTALVRLPDSVGQCDRSHIPQVTMQMSALVRPVQRISKSDFLRRGRIEITSVLPMQAPQITPSNLVWHLGSKGDTLTLWLPDEHCDSASIILHDPSGLHDTLQLHYHEKSGKGRLGSRQGSTTTPLMKSLVGATVAPFDSLWVTFDNPVHISGNPDSLVRVVNLQTGNLSTCGMALDKSGLRARILLSAQAGRKYQLTLPQGSFTDLYGHPTDSLSIITEVVPLDQFGNIYLTLAADKPSPEGQLLVQLTDEKGTLLHEQHVEASTLTNGASVKVRFQHLKAAKYKVQVIQDCNNNGKWDAGNYWQHLQPERVYYFDKTLELRQNWDIEEKVNLQFE